MEHTGRILMADDEESFLKSTAALLRRQGYECDCVANAPGAIEKLRGEKYDLLIADIKMPGNNDLELIRAIPTVSPGLPVIMETGYPSLETAAQSIELPVVAYLVKPVDFEQLLAQTRIAVEYSRTFRLVAGAPAQIQDWRVELSNVRRMISQTSGETSLPGIDAFITQTFRMIVSHLADLKAIIENLALRNLEQQASNGTTAGWHPQIVDTLFETLAVLEKAKSNPSATEFEALRLKLKKVIQGEIVH